MSTKEKIADVKQEPGGSRGRPKITNLSRLDTAIDIEKSKPDQNQEYLDALLAKRLALEKNPEEKSVLGFLKELAIKYGRDYSKSSLKKTTKRSLADTNPSSETSSPAKIPKSSTFPGAVARNSQSKADSRAAGASLSQQPQYTAVDVAQQEGMTFDDGHDYDIDEEDVLYDTGVNEQEENARLLENGGRTVSKGRAQQDLSDWTSSLVMNHKLALEMVHKIVSRQQQASRRNRGDDEEADKQIHVANGSLDDRNMEYMARTYEEFLLTVLPDLVSIAKYRKKTDGEVVEVTTSDLEFWAKTNKCLTSVVRSWVLH